MSEVAADGSAPAGGAADALLRLGDCSLDPYDRFGWTTRSSELYESRLLRIGSPVFHTGLFFVVAGHVIGLLIPESWTAAVGVSEATYHALALALGVVAGVLTFGGLVLLIRRRRTTGPVFLATTRNDKAMYVFLVTALGTGLATTLINAFGATHDYRTTGSPWLRSLFTFLPDTALMAEAPTEYHIHVTVALLLFALLPFTRLVHAFTAPVAYLFRPYLVYRSRDVARGAGTARPRRGWERTGS
ncbi:respiratory nitrate reductase subunit gamma [Streptomyces sp. NPDC047117]|uniref:respiratory nitrate reductase subunit gamma n=1 Tax=Streptomyces sp. NPDC047117 TaxID=3155379 RepID=UPI00340338FB